MATTSGGRAMARQAGLPEGPGRRNADTERIEVCHVQLHDLLLLLALRRERLRLRVLRHLQHGSAHRRGARRRGALLLRQRVRLHRLRVPPELRLRRVTGADRRVIPDGARLASRAPSRVVGIHDES